MKREKNSGTGRGGVDQSTSRGASTRSSAVTALQSMAAGDPVPYEEASGRRTLASERAGGGGGAGGVVVGERVSSPWVIWGFFWGKLGVSAERRGERQQAEMRFAFWVVLPQQLLSSTCWC